MKATRTCTVEDCDAPHRARGYCNRHYKQWQNDWALKSDIIDGLRRSDWEKIDRTSPEGCWLWTGAYSSHTGYGRVGWKSQVRDAHRYVWERLRGPVPAGLELDHLCRNRRCCNPGHLEPVTHQTNVLRGVSPASLHARKTHCPRGHQYDGVVNRVSEGRTARKCLECDRQAARRYYYRAKHDQGDED